MAAQPRKIDDAYSTIGLVRFLRHAIEHRRFFCHVYRLARSNGLVRRWALSDPEAARKWMDANVDPYENWEPTQQLAVGWAQVDPQAAMDWLTSLPRDLQTKGQYDQVGAAKWLAEAGLSPLLDIPFERYIYRVRHANPPEAMEWAKSITDAQRRQRMMEEVAEVWRKKDPTALDQFIATDPAGEGLE